MAWSPYKDRVIGYVERNPGCTKWDVASYCTYNRQRCPSKQYYIVNTAIRNGWIEAVWKGNRWALYPADYQELPEAIPSGKNDLILHGANLKGA
jgi:hypothetical protein